MAYLTVLTILRDGSHLMHQYTGALPADGGVPVGSHLALRQRHYGDDVVRFVIVDRDNVTEHVPN